MTTETRRQAADPETPLDVLAELAYQHPELRAAIAANPSTYPDLLEWLGNLGDPEVDRALRARDGGSAERRAADPATAPEVLAELAYQHPELREVIAENPSAYDGLREWIASAGTTPAPVQASSTAVVASVVAAPRVSMLARANSKFGPTFTLDSLVTVIAISIASIASLVAGNLVMGAVGSAISETVSSFAFAGDGVLDNITDSSGGSAATGDDQGQAGSTGADNSSSGSTGTATQPAPEPQFVPTVLIFDASGSMVRSIPSGGTRMAAARSAAITFVQGLSDTARMGLTVFGTGTGNADSDQAAGCFDVKRMIPVGAVDKAAFTSTIAGIVESGYTPLGPSMRDAAEQLAGFDTAQIVLVTDGIDTCSPPTACEVATELHAARPGLTIHTIGFAVDADEQAQEQLSCIASAGGGEAVDAGDAAQLAARLRAISDPVSTAGSVTSAGFNGLKLGMSVEQAKGVDSSVTLGKVVLDIQYADCDDATLLFKAGRLYGIQPKKPAPTAEGVAPGDSLSAAIGVYGPATPVTDSDGTYAQFPATKGSDSGYRVYYTPDSPGALSGKIIRIVLCVCGPGGGTVSEMTNWQVGFDGVGPIKLGMPLSEVFEIVSDPGPDAVVARTTGCTATRLALGGVGSQIVLVTTPGASGDVVQNIMVTALGGVAASRLPKTASGVGVDSTSKEIRIAYPEVTSIGSQGGSYQITTNAEGRSLIFDERGGDRSVQLGTRLVDQYRPCP